MFFSPPFRPPLHLLWCPGAVAGSSGTGQDGENHAEQSGSADYLKSASSFGLARQRPQGRIVAQTSVAFLATS